LRCSRPRFAAQFKGQPAQAARQALGALRVQGHHLGQAFNKGFALTRFL